MKTLIIYDSFFGNTEKIAQAIGAALGAQEDVGIFRVGNVQPGQLAGVEMLFVGSPTRQFGPTPAIKSFLQGIPADGLKGVKATAFDTRLTPSDVKSPVYSVLAGIFGYAAGPIAKLLKGKGADMVMPPESFTVLASEGPLKEGELARAAEWAKRSA